MLTESQVIAAVCHFLKQRRFQIKQQLSEKQKGYDIIAVAPDGKEVVIEAKGETSSMAHTNRFGKEFSTSQIFDHVSKAVYCAATYVSKNIPGGIALPMNKGHQKHVAAILPALKALEIEVFWVPPSGEVQVAGHWPWWANSTVETAARKSGARGSP